MILPHIPILMTGMYGTVRRAKDVLFTFIPFLILQLSEIVRNQIKIKFLI